MKTSEYFKLRKVVPLKELGFIDHTDGNCYEYVLYSDNYVYQRKNGDSYVNNLKSNFISLQKRNHRIVTQTSTPTPTLKPKLTLKLSNS